MTRGCGWEGLLSALRNSRLAASASRNADSRKSIVAPAESMAVEVTPTALYANVRLIDTPGFVGRLEMTGQPLIQFGTITLNPTPDRRVICLQTALGKQLLHIGKRQRVPKIPAHGAKNQLWRRLPPLEDRWSSCHCGLHFSLPASRFQKLQHNPVERPMFNTLGLGPGMHESPSKSGLGILRRVRFAPT